MDIERFDVGNGNTPFCQGCYQMEEGELGDYVRFDDYESLVKERDSLLSERDEAVRLLHIREQQWIESKNEARELRAEREQLLAQDAVGDVDVSLKTADLCAYLNGRGYQNLKAGDKLYAKAVPEPSPAVAVPDENTLRSIFEQLMKDCPAALSIKNDVWNRQMPDQYVQPWLENNWSGFKRGVGWMASNVSPSPRITEQDAREIVGSAFKYYRTTKRAFFTDDWLEFGEGRALLNKLNANHESN